VCGVRRNGGSCEHPTSHKTVTVPTIRAVVPAADALAAGVYRSLQCSEWSTVPSAVTLFFHVSFHASRRQVASVVAPSSLPRCAWCPRDHTKGDEACGGLYAGAQPAPRYWSAQQ